MKRYLPIFAGLAISLIGSAMVPSLEGAEPDQKLTITLSRPITIQGVALPAGRYVLKAPNPFDNRYMLSIFSGDGTRLMGNVLAMHAQRPRATGRSEFSFYDSRAGEPAALHKLFYPGESDGFEFLDLQGRAASDSGVSGH